MTILRSRKQFTTALAFNQNGDKLAVGGKVRTRDGRNTGRIDVWNLSGEHSLTSLPTIPGNVLKIAFASDESLIAIVSSQVLFFSGAGFRESQIIKEWSDEEYRVLTIVPNASRIVIQTVRTLELVEVRPSFCQVWSRPAYVNNLSVAGVVAFSPDGRRLAVPRDRSVEVRDFATGEVLSMLEKPIPDQFLGYHLYWSTDGRWIVATTHDWLNVWNAESGKHVFHLIPPNREWIIAAIFHAQTGQMGVMTHFAFKIYEPETWLKKRSLTCPGYPTYAAVLNTAGNVAVGTDLGVIMWNVPW